LRYASGLRKQIQLRSESPLLDVLDVPNDGRDLVLREPGGPSVAVDPAVIGREADLSRPKGGQVAVGYRYTIGIAMKGPTPNVLAYGFRVSYSI
jgi:hypothetical protein